MISEVFSVGDVVYLKSGGPPMSVLAITQEGRIQVGWQNFYGDFNSREFAAAVLTTEAPEVPEPGEGRENGYEDFGGCSCNYD